MPILDVVLLRIESEIPVISILGRTATAVALIAGVVVLAPAASAQSGSRLCGRQDGDSLYLVEVDKDSSGWGEFDSQYQACENVQQRHPDSRNCNFAKCYEYAKCESVSSDIGWSGYSDKPSGYNPRDICASMKRGKQGYLVKLSGNRAVSFGPW